MQKLVAYITSCHHVAAAVAGCNNRHCIVAFQLLPLKQPLLLLLLLLLLVCKSILPYQCLPTSRPSAASCSCLAEALLG